MQGLYLTIAPVATRLPTKAAARRAIEDNSHAVYIEATSIFGNEYDGPVDEAPDGEYYLVGPDPYTKRTWYGTLTVKGDKITLK